MIPTDPSQHFSYQVSPPRQPRTIWFWLLIPALALIFFLSSCADDGEVRDACAEHNGVQAVAGNSIRKLVTCKDGYFRTIR